MKKLLIGGAVLLVLCVGLTFVFLIQLGESEMPCDVVESKWVSDVRDIGDRFALKVDLLFAQDYDDLEGREQVANEMRVLRSEFLALETPECGAQAGEAFLDLMDATIALAETEATTAEELKEAGENVKNATDEFAVRLKELKDIDVPVTQ